MRQLAQRRSRTLMTSVTTLLVVLILFFFGGPDLKSLSFALIVGIVVGTYSSIFVATPLAVDFLKRQGSEQVIVSYKLRD